MIEVENLTVSLDGKKILHNLSFHIPENKKVAVIGESGKGKTTLLNTLMGFVPHYTGKITVNKIDLNPKTVHQIRKIISYLPQDLHFSILSSAKELFYKPFEFEANKHLYPSSAEVNRILKKFKLPPDIFSKGLKEISGGQKQRVALAGILLLKKPVLFLDEPTSALDAEIKKDIMDYIFSLDDITLMAATHDEEWIKRSEIIINLNQS